MLYNQSHIEKLAHFILEDCVNLSTGDYVIIEGIDVSAENLLAFANIFRKCGINPIVLFKSNSILISNSNLENVHVVEAQAEYELKLLKMAKAFIGLREPKDLFESNQMTSQGRSYLLDYFIKPVHFSYRNSNLQWLYFRLPSYSLFKSMVKSKEEVDNYFKSTFLSYRNFSKEMISLERKLLKTKNVRITSRDMDLEFEMSGSGVYKSAGKHNLPDGEVFVSPMKFSLNGNFIVNVPTTYLGNYFESMQLTFENGRVSKAQTPTNVKNLNELLNTDDGARYCGEFAFGLNPFIVRPINDILHDEKMAGSIHLALGNAYPEADNGNRSAIHWDLIYDMRTTEAEVYLDDERVMKGGVFITKELLNLNMDNLKGKIQL